MANKTDKEISDHEFDIFVANSVFPEAKTLFKSGPQSLEKIKDECIVILDTNVLLTPFNTGKDSLKQIEKTFRTLVETNRLIIPGQVAREFVKNRAPKLAEVFQQLNRKISSIPQLQKGRYPLLESHEIYKEVVSLEAEIDAKIRAYRSKLEELLKDVRGWIWNDPVSLIYSELFTEDTILDPKFDQEQVKKDLKKQRLHNLPPGYKDAQKADRGVGDLLVWKTILEVGKTHKRSVIFVTGDEKADWWYRSEKQALYPRYELVDEFRRVSEGQLFHMIYFSAFLDLFGASKEVVEEVRGKESAGESFILLDTFPQDGQRITREQIGNFYLKFNNPIDVETEPYIVNYNVQNPGYVQWNIAGWIEYAENNTKLIWHPHPQILSNDAWFSPSKVDYQKFEIHLGRRGIDEWMLKDVYGNVLPFTVIRVFIPADDAQG